MQQGVYAKANWKFLAAPRLSQWAWNKRFAVQRATDNPATNHVALPCFSLPFACIPVLQSNGKPMSKYAHIRAAPYRSQKFLSLRKKSFVYDLPRFNINFVCIRLPNIKSKKVRNRNRKTFQYELWFSTFFHSMNTTYAIFGTGCQSEKINGS